MSPTCRFVISMLLRSSGLILTSSVVNARIIDYNAGAPKDLIRNGPGFFEALEHRGIHNKVHRDRVRNRYLRRISSAQDSCRQFSCLLADLIEVRAVIE